GSAWVSKRILEVAPATNASVLPASYHVAPMAAARETGTSGWSLHETHANPACSAACAAATISPPPISRSHGRRREGICCTAGRLVPNGIDAATVGSYPQVPNDVKANAVCSARPGGENRTLGNDDRHRIDVPERAGQQM